MEHKLIGGVKAIVERKKKYELTDKEYKQIQSMAAIRVTEEQMAYILGIPPATFFRMLKRDKRLSDSIKNGKANGSAKIKKRAYEIAMSGDSPSMLMFWLKTQERWSESDKFTLPEGDSTKEAVKKMSSEERQAKIQEYERLKKISLGVPDETK